ncbi:MAG: protein-L-isoaspartate(D-aspartate) O-methyltransferase [Planctomycetes bacterium]|nr:protein-L-isoaspartate(D-aspartate) O-methyltransferase [Planctomycetota bacterium]
MSLPNLELQRWKMVRDQLEKRGITSQSVLEAMGRVPRERFMPPELLDEAYADRALSIDCGQTISQPYIVALMTQALALTGGEKVLDVGTGSGYQAAILSLLAREVISIERHAELSEEAGEVLDELGCDNVRLVVGDGTLGYLAEAPYDRIIVAAAARQVPTALWDQLRDGGILVIPVGDADAQMLEQITKTPPEPRVIHLAPCRFVPLIGAE